MLANRPLFPSSLFQVWFNYVAVLMLNESSMRSSQCKKAAFWNDSTSVPNAVASFQERLFWRIAARPQGSGIDGVPYNASLISWTTFKRWHCQSCQNPRVCWVWNSDNCFRQMGLQSGEKSLKCTILHAASRDKLSLAVLHDWSLWWGPKDKAVHVQLLALFLDVICCGIVWILHEALSSHLWQI